MTGSLCAQGDNVPVPTEFAFLMAEWPAHKNALI